jgi:hypothetical protein
MTTLIRNYPEEYLVPEGEEVLDDLCYYYPELDHNCKVMVVKDYHYAEIKKKRKQQTD